MISQVSSLSLSAASAASRETDRSRYRASGSAAPGTRSNLSAAAQTSGSRHTRRPFEVPSGRFANTTSSRPALSCSINSALTPIRTSRLTSGWSFGEAAERRRQRAAGDLLDHAETHRARQPRRRQAMTGRFLKLQQATRAAEQHLAIVGQCDTARRPPEQGPFGLELKPLDLLTYRRLR